MSKLKATIEAKAHAKGVKARQDGVHPTQNPYKKDNTFRAWLNGWMETDNAIIDAELKDTFSDPKYTHSLLNPNNLVMGGKWGQFNKLAGI